MRTTRLTTDDTRPEVTKRLPELDGIRGCAILLVLVWHYVQNQLHPEVGTLLAYFRQAIGFTWSGVDLFFVLSGFLIAGILIDQRGSPHYFRAFYIRRVCRIFPLYYINIGIFLAFLAWQSDLDQVFAPLFGGSEVPLWSYFSFTQNIFMGANNSAGAGWLAVTWSLAVEEQFYLFLPFIVWIVPRNRLPLVFLWVAGTAIFLRSSMPGLSAYINTPWRADALDEVIGPDVVGAFRPEPDAGAVIEPEAALLQLFPGDFQPFALPDPLNPLVVHLPARLVQHAGDHAIAVATIVAGQLDHVLGQAFLVRATLRDLALGRAVLAKSAAGPAFGDAVNLPHVVDAPTTTRRAQKFPWAASVRMSLSSVRSETARLSRWFSFSSSFRRLSCARPIPP